jgi:hypothetical protein
VRDQVDRIRPAGDTGKIRMTNAEGQKKSETLMTNGAGMMLWPFGHSGFVMLSDFVIRHSVISLTAGHLSLVMVVFGNLRFYLRTRVVRQFQE